LASVRVERSENRVRYLGMGADILADILRLKAEERARLALELIRSLDGEPEAGAAQAWDAEIERRGTEVDRGAADTMTLDEYRAHVRRRRATRANR
jgi:putative addiction module component (TIGR02574 family)